VTTASVPGRPDARPGPTGHRLSTLLHNHPVLRLGGLLAGPVAWLGIVYVGSLVVLLIAAFWTVDAYTGALIHTFTLSNFQTLLTQSVYWHIIGRTVAIALAVTVFDFLLALPMAFFMAKVASPRSRSWLVVAILTPLWSNYLVKAYAWLVIFSNGGLVDWVTRPFGIPNPGLSTTATVVTLAYLWLPYMVLPLFAGLERLPDSILQASSDLGARPWYTVRRAVLPMVTPAILAGCITTFSLSLGDYIAVSIVGGTTQMIGNVILSNVGSANNLPFAATLAIVPAVIMVILLFAVRRTGALDAM
jgi:putative spermidine/putrescine transport system permease protein